MKMFKWIYEHLLFVVTLILLVFIPLYPKLPLLDVKNTWVYVRAEDFVVIFVLLIWTFLFVRKKVTLKTPLTIPILVFWIIGGLATFHGVLLIFPTISNVFSNVAILSFFRRIEYIFLFFIAFASIKDKKFMNHVIYVLAFIVIAISLYGFGQKSLGFPAYLTMNEEFAKGIPIRLSEFGRVTSTFAGHYDLAAYLVLVIPILVSVAIFGLKNWLGKILLLVSAILGCYLLPMTVSRVSIAVLALSIVVLLFLQSKKWFVGLIVSMIILSFTFYLAFKISSLNNTFKAPLINDTFGKVFDTAIFNRFGNTLKEVIVLVDSKTGSALGEIKEVNAEYFKEKVVQRQFVSDDEVRQASGSAILPFSLIPHNPILLIEPNEPTGEDLPQGTGYINLPLSPVVRRTSLYFVDTTNQATNSAQVFFGDFIIKRAYAYDLSFTTRFQGEWPKTVNAFKRNIFIGSGYASVTLAVDNNYLRILGESGLLGLMSFLSIFLVAGLYIKKILPKVDSPVTRSFVLGFVAGTFGLMLNAIFIDVFEASKVAFTYWLLMGITLGALTLYKTWNIDLYNEFKKAIISPFAIIVYLFIITMALYFSGSIYYFTGDDFIWFRWVENSKLSISTFINDFTNSNGFFYRPGTKVYFSLMYSVFWLNQAVYHFVSFFLHFAVAALIFLVSTRILKNYFLAVVTAILFVSLSGYQEAVFWISSTGFLFNAFFVFLGLISFIYWRERKKTIFLIISFISIILSLLFHELGVIAAFLIITYDRIFGGTTFKESGKIYMKLLLPLLPYFVLRFLANSHWFNGDYSYNLLKLPYNFVGNVIGYVSLDILGPISLPIYDALRSFGRSHVPIAILASLVVISIFVISYRLFMKKITNEEKKVIIFAILFFIISLLPFLGLGNITSRYSYLSSFGIVLLLALIASKLYSYLLVNGKSIAIAGITMITIIFFSIHLFQLQKIHSDWYRAGNISKKFLISLNQIYTDTITPKKFYFVDVPIRYGEAWVFPVGLEDALWFSFRNSELSVHTKESLIPALKDASVSTDTRVFQFDKDSSGGIEEVFPAYLKEIEQ